MAHLGRYTIKTGVDEYDKSKTIELFKDGIKTHGWSASTEEGFKNRLKLAKEIKESKEKEDKEGGKWITVKGKHIFIKSGQNLSDALSMSKR